MDTKKDTMVEEIEITDMKSALEALKQEDTRMRETRQWIREENERRWKEEERRWKENERLREEEYRRRKEEQDRFDKRLKGLSDLYTNNWGRLVESLSQPAVLSLFKEKGIGITHIYEGPREDVSDPDNAIEVDTILCNTTVAVVTEVKTTCRPDDIDHFLMQMERFKTIFHEFADKTVYVAIAAIRYDGYSDRYAQKKGLFVIKTTGEGIFSIDEPAQRRTY